MDWIFKAQSKTCDGTTVTRVDDVVLLVEGDPGAPPLPLGPLDLQVALLDGEQRDAFVVRRVELCQILQRVTRHT